MKRVPDNWVFLHEVSYEVLPKRVTKIFIYSAGDVFGAYLPINCYMVTASSEAEVINECRAECDRYFEKEKILDDIPF